jgi:hypothetical protein
MRSDEYPFSWTSWSHTNQLTKPSCLHKSRPGHLGTGQNGRKRLVVLFEAGSIDVRHIIGEDLHLAFLRHCA